MAIFDTAPQLAAMLHDSLPRDERGNALPGCIAMFLDRHLQVIASNAPVAIGTPALGWIRETAKSGAARRAKPLGLLVEVLGDVSEVPTDRLLPIDGCSDQLATLAIEPADPNAPLVMILSPERLAILFYGASHAAAEILTA